MSHGLCRGSNTALVLSWPETNSSKNFEKERRFAVKTLERCSADWKAM